MLSKNILSASKSSLLNLNATHPSASFPDIQSFIDNKRVRETSSRHKHNKVIDPIYSSNSNSLASNCIMELQRTIFHQVKTQALEPLSWILPWCLSPISASFHHGNKFIITDTTILNKCGQGQKNEITDLIWWKCKLTEENIWQREGTSNFSEN